MAKKILYLGNKLSGLNRNLTTIEILGQKLQDLSYVVKSYSDQRSKLLRLTSMLSAIIRHRKYDYVLIDTYSTSAFWFAWASAKLCQVLDITYIMILHGGNLPERLQSHNKYCLNIFVKSNINITPSAYLYEKFRNAGYSNLKIIPNSINIENYTFRQRQDIQPKLLWVRAFTEIYNPLLALKVLKNLIKTYPQAQLGMVGPFKDKSIDKCREYATKHQLSVKFTGRLTKKEWISYSEEFDIFINTTNIDNTPVSVIEAMALGLPVVSTNVGGIPYLIENGKNGLLVPSDDVEKMHNAVCELLNDEQLTKRLSINGRKMAESFDWQIVKEMWKDVLK